MMDILSGKQPKATLFGDGPCYILKRGSGRRIKTELIEIESGKGQ